MASEKLSAQGEAPSPPPAAAADHSAQDESTEVANEAAGEPDAKPEPTDTTSSPESGAASSPSSTGEPNESNPSDAPPLPNEAPPLPEGPPPGAAPEDDGWDFHWDATSQAYFFHNRLTGVTTWDNPRTTGASAAAASASQPGAPGTSSIAAASSSEPPPLPTSRPAAGGYNPAIHGDYDPNAWYAQGTEDEDAADPVSAYPDQNGLVSASFNRFTGHFQRAGEGPDRHSDEAKSKRQMNAFFDVDAAANAHDGRSLKAERSGKKISKSELKHFKEKRKARKEEKRRAWLRD